MAQGAFKPKPSSKPSKTAHSASARSKASNPRSATTRTAPKNARVAKLQKQARKSAAGLTSALEARLAERAGHTEMIGGKGGVKRKGMSAGAGRGGAEEKGKKK